MVGLMKYCSDVNHSKKKARKSKHFSDFNNTRFIDTHKKVHRSKYVSTPISKNSKSKVVSNGWIKTLFLRILSLVKFQHHYQKKIANPRLRFRWLEVGDNFWTLVTEFWLRWHILNVSVNLTDVNDVNLKRKQILIT